MKWERYKTEKLREFKKEIEAELSERRTKEIGYPIGLSKLYAVLMPQYHSYGRNYEDELRKISNYTEEEFLQYRNVGKATLKAAIQELDRLGLKFKENE